MWAEITKQYCKIILKSLSHTLLQGIVTTLDITWNQIKSNDSDEGHGSGHGLL
jgi:hypothetical protein